MVWYWNALVPYSGWIADISRPAYCHFLVLGTWAGRIPEVVDGRGRKWIPVPRIRSLLVYEDQKEYVHVYILIELLQKVGTTEGGIRWKL